MTAVVVTAGAVVAEGNDARLELPPGTRVTIHLPEADGYLSERRLTTFYPDGTMTAAQLTLNTENVRHDIVLSPFSGISYQTMP